jgi:hypothetical protein
MALEAGKAATGHDRTAGPVARPAQGPKRWKHFLITVMGVYPLTILVPISLTWLAHYLPGAVRANCYNIIATSGRRYARGYLLWTSPGVILSAQQLLDATDVGMPA